MHAGMLKSSGAPCIHLQGVRHNNLKNFDLDLPLNQLIVVTGLSGSGKSSLAFDTLFAEGQRRYIETFSPYARQFLDRMDKPQVDSIQGIPPAIAIEQRNSVKTTRSTVGTMTEICDFMKVLWPHVAKLHCRGCGMPVTKEPPAAIWTSLMNRGGLENSEVLVTFTVPLSEKLGFKESLGLIAGQGYQRLLIKGEVVRLSEMTAPPSGIAALRVVQDRIKVAGSNRSRFVEACEQAYHFGKGRLEVWPVDPGTGRPAANSLMFSNRLHCAACDIEYKSASPALFNFNHPLGACPTCRGFGRVISIDYNLAVPDRSRTLRQGVVKPWLSGVGAECQADMMRMCREFEVPVDVPFERLAKKWQDLVLNGDPDYGTDEEHEWPRAWYGVKGYFRWLESKAYKMHVRVLLSRYRAYTPCPDCGGSRFQPEAMLYRLNLPGRALSSDANQPGRALSPKAPSTSIEGGGSLTLSGFYSLPIRDALKLVETIDQKRVRNTQDPLAVVLPEVCSRLRYLNDAGLGYLTLDRPTRSLSGGETERVSLTSCLGTRLVNTLFVLDEPSVGLHPRDTDRLVRILEQLRDAGNTVLVVEHEARVMQAADEIVDLGPGHGASGGNVVFQGSFEDILRSPASLTGQYLSGRRRIELPTRRSASGLELYPSSYADAMLRGRADTVFREAQPAIPGVKVASDSTATKCLRLSGVNKHNLRDFSVSIPLNRFVCVTGLSGSGKTTLVREILLPAMEKGLDGAVTQSKASDRLGENASEDGADDDDSLPEAGSDGAKIEGAESLDRVVLVDQSILGKTPRSNPAVYIGAFDDIRDFFAASDVARRRGLNASAFSFNSGQGQCERCRGAGFEKIEMQFLSDVFIRCPDCGGKRYRPHILEIKVSRPDEGAKSSGAKGNRARPQRFSIADLLDATIEEAIDFLGAFTESRPAQRAVQSLRWLSEVGLGYMKLGQPINTLSGGESQRLKLVRHLADMAFPAADEGEPGRQAPTLPADSGRPAEGASGRTLFLFDEPTTGLHFDDVRILLSVLQRLVDAGHSVLVIEHNLDVIKSADWVIDLGPGAGDEGGRLVAAGPPEHVAEVQGSYTGEALRNVLRTSKEGQGAFAESAIPRSSRRDDPTREGRSR